MARRGRSARLRPEIIPSAPANANTPSAEHGDYALGGAINPIEYQAVQNRQVIPELEPTGPEPGARKPKSLHRGQNGPRGRVPMP